MLNRIFLGVMNIIGNLKINGGNVEHSLGHDLTTVGNAADTVEADLNSVIIPANTLKNVGDSLYFYAWGSVGASGNNKIRRIYVNSVMVRNKTGTAANFDWVFEGYIIKISSTQQKVVVFSFQSTSNVIGAETTLTEDTTAAITIKTTGQNNVVGTANDIEGKGLFVRKG